MTALVRRLVPAALVACAASQKPQQQQTPEQIVGAPDRTERDRAMDSHRKPAPMLADFAAEIAAGHVVVIEIGGVVAGYMIAWPEVGTYFIDNIAVDPARQREGL